MIDDNAMLRVDCRNDLGEAPLWCQASGTLYWIDVTKPGRVFHWQPTDERIDLGERRLGEVPGRIDAGRGNSRNRVDFWDFDDLVTGLNLVRGGGLLVHGKNQIRRFDPATGETRSLFSLPPSNAGMRFNDGHCDQAGRLWVGTMPNNISDDGAALDILRSNGQIWVITGNEARSIDACLGCPNAICWSPDGATFYIADSCDRWLYAYHHDASTATISDKRRFCYLDGLGIPDGAAVDREGYLWNARWGAGAVARIAPDGSLDRIVRLPVSQPTSCCFGDADGQTLYITSARFALPTEELHAEPLAGGVFSIRLPVGGVPVPLFDAGTTAQSLPA